MVDENVIENIVMLDSKPYLLVECNDGLYYVVKSYFLKNKSGILHFNSDSSRPLRLGLDIIEVPTRGLSLVVRSTPGDAENFYRLVFGELRKFAEICGRDYFNFEPFSGYINRSLCINGREEISEIKPRLFYQND